MPSRREDIFYLALRYGRTVRRLNLPLHSVVSIVTHMPVWWRQSAELSPDEGMIGEAYLEPDYGVQVLTAPCSRNPALVSFVYTHELAHYILQHHVGEEAGLLVGWYTTKEAEASAFALAYLYSISDRSPCLQILTPQQIFTSFRRIHQNDRGFYYGANEKVADLELIKRIQRDMRRKA